MVNCRDETLIRARSTPPTATARRWRRPRGSSGGERSFADTAANGVVAPTGAAAPAPGLLASADRVSGAARQVVGHCQLNFR
jgi:hypothetical protein